MTPDDAIRIVHEKAALRTRYEGQEPFLDEVLVAEVERLRAERDRLAAAVCSLRDLWPTERWATLSGICRDHPCIDKAAQKARGA